MSLRKRLLQLKVTPSSTKQILKLSFFEKKCCQVRKIGGDKRMYGMTYNVTYLLHCPMIQCHSTNHVNNEMDIVTQRLIECNCLFQVIANSLLLLCGNLIGYYYQFMNAKSQDKSFEQTRSTVESRVKLECEKEHQEQLLLSVIPAYIAAEVKQLFKLFCTVVFCAN